MTEKTVKKAVVKPLKNRAVKAKKTGIRNEGILREDTAAKKEKTGEENDLDPMVKEIFYKATLDAALILQDILKDPEGDVKQKLDAAKSVLDRVYGKSIRPLGEDDHDGIELILSSEVKKYAR